MNDVSGKVQFNISVRVSAEEIATWLPEKIAAFFGGARQVIEARDGSAPAPASDSTGDKGAK